MGIYLSMQITFVHADLGRWDVCVVVRHCGLVLRQRDGPSVAVTRLGGW